MATPAPQDKTPQNDRNLSRHDTQYGPAASAYGDDGWATALQMPSTGVTDGPASAPSDLPQAEAVPPQGTTALAQQVEFTTAALSPAPDITTQVAANDQVAVAPAVTLVEQQNETVIQPTEARAISDTYQITTASVTGRAHLGYGDIVAGGNNQDSLFAALREDYGIVVVCDGCSKTKHSEVGAKILTRLFTEAFQKNQHIGIVHQILAKVEAEVESELAQIVDKMVLDNESRDDVVREYFLCTVLGAYISTAGVTFWGMGDGVYGFDSHMRHIEPAPGNYPAYFGYKLYGKWPQNIAQHGLEIYDQVMHHPSSILLGTDGVKDLLDLGDKNFPGTHDAIGKIERLWKEDRYWENSDELARELRRMQTIRKTSKLTTTEEAKLGVKRVITELSEMSEGGYLPDDTTLAILREIPQAPAEVKPKISSGIFDRAPMSQVGRRSVGSVQHPDDKAVTSVDTVVDPLDRSTSKPTTTSNTESVGIFQRLGNAISGVFSWLRRLFTKDKALPVAQAETDAKVAEQSSESVTTQVDAPPLSAAKSDDAQTGGAVTQTMQADKETPPEPS